MDIAVAFAGLGTELVSVDHVGGDDNAQLDADERQHVDRLKWQLTVVADYGVAMVVDGGGDDDGCAGVGAESDDDDGYVDDDGDHHVGDYDIAELMVSSPRCQCDRGDECCAGLHAYAVVDGNMIDYQLGLGGCCSQH